MKPSKAVFIHSDKIECYHYPQNCPFKTERAALTKSILVSMNYYTGEAREEMAPVLVADDVLFWFH